MSSKRIKKIPLTSRSTSIFLLEGLEEQASTGPEVWTKRDAKKGAYGFFAGVNYVCIVSI